jgi:molybdopterin synthase sulfur carrier subunit
LAVKIILPAALRRLCGGAREVFVQGATVQELIRNLQDQYPDLRGRLCGGGGEIREFIRIFKNSEDTHFLRGGDTPVEDGDEVELVPAVLGG